MIFTLVCLMTKTKYWALLAILPLFAGILIGMSIFALKDGQVYHTYSVYARGMEDFLTVYRFLDVVPKGRDEDNLSFGMDWIKLKDNYAESR